ncbi:MAG: 50S ribosomal protein L21 [Candidatus Omnitrophica bacterium]|nr:50S ribosomal protein L21 [Candidatus Omnitrophota bacterium]MDD5352728.1 50S ribosomal protein L21 [Candidatus Omnitrophota bacterium]MDD5550327.1 50S ribosomal protein L21 [Candidatus Omnitrophota bacterium]
MYAVIQTGGKQYKVQEGDIINVEKLDLGKSKKEVSFNEVLLGVDNDEVIIGQPIIKGAKVKAEVLGDIREKKIVTYKYKRRKSYHKTIGHRQNLTKVKIKEITLKKE